MRDFIYKRDLRTDSYFLPEELYRCIDYSSGISGEGPRYDLTDTQVQEWLQGGWEMELDRDYNIDPVCMRVLVLGPTHKNSHPEDFDGLDCSREVFLTFAKNCGFSQSVLKMLCGEHGSIFFETDKISGLVIATSNDRCGKSAVAYHHGTRFTSVLFQEGDHLPWWKFKQRLKPVTDTVMIPTLFQLIQLQHNIEELNDEIREAADALESISKDLNLNPWEYSKDGERLGNFNQLTSATLEITRQRQALAAVKILFLSQRDDIKTLLRMHEKIKDLFENADREKPSREARAWREVNDSIDLVLCKTEKLLTSTDLEIAIAQALSTQVSSLIGSQENKLSLEAAETASKDSKDMRMIALVTFMLLPATCIASLFSTSFFDWRAKSWSAAVSPSIAIYFITTIISTGFVFLCWHMKTRKEQKLTAQKANQGGEIEPASETTFATRILQKLLSIPQIQQLGDKLGFSATVEVDASEQSPNPSERDQQDQGTLNDPSGSPRGSIEARDDESSDRIGRDSPEIELQDLTRRSTDSAATPSARPPSESSRLHRPIARHPRPNGLDFITRDALISRQPRSNGLEFISRDELISRQPRSNGLDFIPRDGLDNVSLGSNERSSRGSLEASQTVRWRDKGKNVIQRWRKGRRPGSENVSASDEAVAGAEYV